MEKEMTPNEKDHSRTAEVCLPKLRRRVWEILSPVPVSGKCSEKDYERLFIRDPGSKGT